jgi:hypothetical protein
MAFWDGYWKSLKPLDVEEPVDVWVHRPLAYILARAAYPTPVSPNMITLGSIVLGVSAGACMLAGFRWHMQAAALGIFLSAVLDCADGQLARLRGTSSAFGRMLDGAADLVVSTAVVAGGTYVVYRQFEHPWWHGLLAVLLCVATILTGSFHTSAYDHYKNVFLRFTHPQYREGEDYEHALQRYRDTDANAAWWVRLVWPIYLFYVKSQADFVGRFDPWTPRRLSLIPAYDAATAAVYRAHAAGLMRVWRSFFGFGSLVFGMSLAMAFELVPHYMLLRLILLNAIFYGYLRPRQRVASRAALERIGITSS